MNTPFLKDFFSRENSDQTLLQSVSPAIIKNGPVDDCEGSKIVKKEYQVFPLQEVTLLCSGRGRKKSSSLKLKSSHQTPEMIEKGYKSEILRKSCCSDNPPPRKQPRKGKNPARFTLNADNGCGENLYCKNSACKAPLSPDHTFCRRCSCVICHLYDENKDPSLWLACMSETGVVDSCGMECHLECALQHGKAGVVKLGPLMQLDGSYCCASCGKVSSIIGLWKEQLMVAKEARHLDILCHRLSLSHRILEGTSEFKELHTIVEEARHKLELDLGPLDNTSIKMVHAMTSRSSVCNDVQKLCSAAIESAKAFLNSTLQANLHSKVELSPEACNIRFEDVSPTSLLVVVNESILTSDAIKEFKVWFCKVAELPHQKVPAFTYAKSENRFQMSDLQPDTEYAFRIVPSSDEGGMGLFEARGFTKKLLVVNEKSGVMGFTVGDENVGIDVSSMNASKDKKVNDSSDLDATDVGEVIEVEEMQENEESDAFLAANVSQCSHGSLSTEVIKVAKHHSLSRELDLNVELVPDLNEEAIPTLESSKDEDNGYVPWTMNEAGKDTIFDVSGINGEVKSDDRETARRTGDMPAVESRTQLCRKRLSSDAHDDSSTFIYRTSYMFDRSNLLDETYEQCLKAIRCLERGGHVKLDFRVKFFTWLSLFSTEQERKVVVTYIKTLEDDPSSLAGQLVDSFGETIVSKRPKKSCDDKLWK